MTFCQALFAIFCRQSIDKYKKVCYNVIKYF